MPPPEKLTQVFFDDDGNVLATKGLTTNPPWIVLKSNKFDGHYYFFNVDTETSAWSVSPDIIGIPKQGEEDEEIEEITGSTSSIDFDSDKVGSLPQINNNRANRNKFSIDVNSEVTSNGKNMNPATPASPLHSWQKNGFRCGTSLDGVPGAALDRRQFLTVSGNGGPLSPTGQASPMVPMSPAGQVAALPKTGFRRAKPTGFDRASKGGGAEEVEEVSKSDDIIEEDDEIQYLPDNPKFTVLEGLGAGGYACVVKVEEAETKKTFAMKVITKSKRSGKKHRNRLRVELRVMTDMKPSPFIQRCYQAFENSLYVYFILDLQTGGDLFYHLVQRISENGWGFPEDQVRILLAETYLGLEHMHKHNMIHRDVKVENIMLDANGHVKLIDFGLSVEIVNDIEPLSPTGSFIYMAPEMIKEKTGGRHTDWWALGVLAYALLTGRTPWSTLTDKDILRREIQTMQISPPRRLSPPAGQLVCSLMTQEFRHRLGTRKDSEVKKANFFISIDWNKLSSQNHPAAFDPGENCVAEADNLSALSAYKKTVHKSNLAEGSSDAGWFMGLPQASKFLE